MGPDRLLEALRDDGRKRYRPVIVKTAFFRRGMIAEVFERSETAALDEERSRQKPWPPETPRGSAAFLGFLRHMGREERLRTRRRAKAVAPEAGGLSLDRLR